MPSHPIDFAIHANVFSLPELTAVFDEKRRLGRWLRVEATLAEVQGELGIIPSEAARAIGAAASLDLLDLDALRRAYEGAKNSLLPLVRELQKVCPPPHGEYVHYGVTTQDIIDTTFVMELREGLGIVHRESRRLEGFLLQLTEKHAATPMMGRTHGQQALPITLGFKSARWLAEIRRHINRLQHLAPRLFVGQMSGAVGSMAALGEKASEMGRLVMDRLGLGWDLLPWHTSRDNIAEAASLLAILAATCEKIANEIYALGKTETGELRETETRGQMNSSAMPHKTNPVLAQRVCVLARQVRALAPLVVDSMIHEHERDPRALWSEWLSMPQIVIYCGTAVACLADVVGHIEVDTKKMLRNLSLHPEQALSEWLVFRLARTMGKMTVQEKIHSLVSKARTQQRPLADILREDATTSAILGPEDFDFLRHPENYTGLAVSLTQAALNIIKTARANDPEAL